MPAILWGIILYVIENDSWTEEQGSNILLMDLKRLYWKSLNNEGKQLYFEIKRFRVNSQ